MSAAKKKAPLSPLEIQLKHLTVAFNRTKSLFSLKKIQTWRDMYLELGHSKGELDYAYSQEQLNKPISFSEIKEQEAIYKLRVFQSNSEGNKGTSPSSYEFENVTYSISTSDNGQYDNRQEDEVVVLQQSEENNNTSVIREQDAAYLEQIEKEKRDKEYEEWLKSPLTSPKQIATLFYFQNKAARQALIKIRDEHKRCILVDAAVGTGKTFVAFAIVRQLLDCGFIEQHNCISPWPIVYITKAPIVEQTKRVGSNLFGICTETECEVVNVEQLRAKFGEQMLRDETIVQGGVEYVQWKWKKKIHPLVFIVDEAHLAKNEDSQQSRIIQALADIDDPVYIICMSATAFLRVTEARYFAVNTHKEIGVI